MKEGEITKLFQWLMPPKTYKEKILEKYFYEHQWDLPKLTWHEEIENKKNQVRDSIGQSKENKEITN